MGSQVKNRSIRSRNPESILKHSLIRFVIFLTKYDRLQETRWEEEDEEENTITSRLKSIVIA